MKSKLAELVVSHIVVGDRVNSELNQTVVDDLAESIKQSGLLTPISVRKVPTDRSTSELHLIAGRHRLEAVRQLGEFTIQAAVFDCDALTARLLEIDENLKRGTLTKEQRDKHIAARVRVIADMAKGPKGAESAPFDTRSQHPSEAGIKKTARDLGIPVPTVRATVQAESLPAPVRAAADAAGLGKTDRITVFRDAKENVGAGLAKVVEVSQAKQDAADKRRQEKSATVAAVVGAARTATPVDDCAQWRQAIAALWNDGGAAEQAWFRRYISNPVAEAAD